MPPAEPAGRNPTPADPDPSANEAERDLRLALLWRLRPSNLRAVRAWIRQGLVPFPWGESSLETLGARLPDGLRAELDRLPGADDAQRARLEMERLGIRFLRCEDAEFPARLREIADPPPFLFLRGDPGGAPERPRVGIVGARAASAAGREIAYTLARDLSLAGCVVVSGLARGIDGEAHRGALEAGGRSVAVLGTGSDLCYPSEHWPIFRQLLERGGVVSEFPPGTPPRPLHFPRRNRILAGLCDVLILVEGSEKSGARSTVDFALEQGREVMAVPRDILHPGSVLPNRLLRDGAALATGVQDILDLLPAGVSAVGGAQERTAFAPGASAEAGGATEGDWADRLWELLGPRSLDFDALVRRLPGVEPARLQARLAHWEILGRVRRIPGGRWARRAPPPR